MRSLIGVFLGTLALGQRTGAQQLGGMPPVRPVGVQIAASADSFGVWSYALGLSDGRVVVNDIGSHRIVFLDATLRYETVAVASTNPESGFIAADDFYHGIAAMAPYPGDSTIFVDGAGGHNSSLTMIDPAGHRGRKVDMPHASALPSLIMARGMAAFDATGRATYRLLPESMNGQNAMRFAPPPRPVSTTPTRDTGIVVRTTPGGRALDTLGFITSPHLELDVVGDPLRGPRSDNIHAINPIRVVDDAAIFPDGTVAFIRGADYHIDWVDPDGTRRSTPPIPHERVPLTAREKAAIVDSTKAWAQAHQHIAASGPIGVRAVTRFVSDTVVPAPALPDYLAPFLEGARADADGHLWIPQSLRPGAKTGGGPLYDVVDRQGRLIDRVQLPAGTHLAAFSPGVVFVTKPNASEVLLASYRIR